MTCDACAAGTFSTSLGASGASACQRCQSGRFSTGLGQIDENICLPCSVGSVAAEGGASCVACGDGTFCPAGSSQPVQCSDPGLICDGFSMDARVGLLPVLVGETCAGALVCPGGTLCSQGLKDQKGVLAETHPTQTHFVIFVNGSLSLRLSCGKTLSYGYERVDAPTQQENRVVLFRLLPAGCLPGHFLFDDYCKPCMAGTFSSVYGALTEAACVACPVGTYASGPGFSECWQCPPGTFQPDVNATICASYQPGKIQPNHGTSSCDACGPGTFQGAGERTACLQCQAGTSQPGWGATSCSECNPRSEFSSTGDATCARCGEEPRFPAGCRATGLPDNTTSLWIAITGAVADECAGVHGPSRVRSGVVRAPKVLRLERWASCRHTLRVLGRPELTKSTVVVGPTRVGVHTMAYNQTFYPAQCRQGAGFAVFFRARPLGMPASLEVRDPTGRHLLFQGSCGAARDGECRTTGFCPTQDVRVRVFGSDGEAGPDVLVKAGAESLQCPPTNSWLLSVELQGPFGPRFPGDKLWFDMRVLDAPDRLLAFQFNLRIKTGFTFLSFRSSFPVEESLTGEDGTLELSGDCSGILFVGGLLGQLGLRLDAEHTGLLRVMEVVDARFMISGGWFAVGVIGRGGSCLHNGFVDALVDFPRCTSLLAEPSRTQLVHWRGVQADANVYPMRIDVRGVWNTRGPARAVEAQCLSLTTTVLNAVSCQEIIPTGVGAGLILVRFESLETVVSVRVLQPVDIRASLAPRTGRITVVGTLLGAVLDITPYVLRQDDVALLCTETGGNVTVGREPILLRWECPPALPSEPAGTVLFLLAGNWTRKRGASFRTDPSYLSPVGSRAAALLFWQGEMVRYPHVLTSDDPSRVVHSDGWLQLVRQGESPRCVSIGGRWMIPVLPPAPVSVDVRLTSNILVVQQDLFKLVPSRAELAVANMILTDGTRLDVRDRLVQMVTGGSLLVNHDDGALETRFHPGTSTVVFALPGIPCVTTSANVSVFASSVVSSEMVCPRCPALLAHYQDPLALRWPDRFPGQIPVAWFLVRRRLVDGNTHDRVEQLQVGGGGVLDGEYVHAIHSGALDVTTAFTQDSSVVIPVIRRWAKSWRLLCNEQACNTTMKLAPSGDGAAQAPFLYPTQLGLAIQLTLHNDSTLDLQDPPDTALFVNEQAHHDFANIPVTRGSLDVRVVLGAAWAFEAEQEASLHFQVDWLESLQLLVPPVLRQLHCTRVWERGTVSLQAVLSDGTRAPVRGRVWTDETFLRFDRDSLSVRPLWPGKSRVHASYAGDMSTSSEVVATMDSILITGLVLDALPREWTAPLLARLPMHATLEPASWLDEEDLVGKAVRWQAQPEGVVDVLQHGELVLRSDHFEPVVVTGTIQSCQQTPPRMFSASIQVNVLPSRPWQIDFGSKEGAPLPAVPVGNDLSVPIFLHCPYPLTLFRALVTLPGLNVTSCDPGELPFSLCDIYGTAGVWLHGDFPASQRSGILLLGTLTGTVLVDGLSRLRVSLAEPGNTTYEFTVRLGVQPVHSVLSRLNSVTPGFSEPEEAVWQAREPTRLVVCCDVLVVSSGSVVQHLVPSSFRLKNISLEPDNLLLSLTDPRLRVDFDNLLLHFNADTQIWTVRPLVSLFEYSTRIELWYQHPGSEVSLPATVLVTLTEPDEIILSPAQLVVKRVHCSPTVFQSKQFSAALMMRDGTSITLSSEDLDSATIQSFLPRPPARVDLTQLAVVGLEEGNATLLVHAFNLSAEILVVVLDESVVLTAVRLSDPYLLVGARGQPVLLEISGTLDVDDADEDPFLSDISFLLESAMADSPIAEYRHPGLLVPMANTHPAQAYHLGAVISACSDTPAFVLFSSLVVRLQAADSQPDVVVDAGPTGFDVTLVADWVQAFVITFSFFPNTPSACLPGLHWPNLADCATEEEGRVILAGAYSEPRPGPVVLATITPMPFQLSGYVELFSGHEGSVRREIVAGRFGNLSSGMPDTLPVADPATLARQYLSRPYNDHSMRETHFTLQLLTNRQRLVDVRLYSNEHELSAMFGVTDRFLTPDETGTTVDVVFLTRKLPAHPNSTDVPEGVRVRAHHFIHGWYVVQWAGDEIPHLRLRVSYQVSTTTSLQPWEYSVSDPLITGRPLHECPRLATDRASFLVVYRITAPLVADWSDANFACAARVAARRVTVSRPETYRGVLTVSVAFESFIRIAQAFQAIQAMKQNMTAIFSALGRNQRHLLLAADVLVELANMSVINDTADPVKPCPPGTFYTRNGTYERLPNHAVAGPDCYGMTCIDGYLLAGTDCLPAPVSPDVIWVCVVVILMLGLFLSCVLCALYMGKRAASRQQQVEMMLPDSAHGSGSVPSEPFVDDDAEFKNIVMGTSLDDFSKTILDSDDDDDFLGTCSRQRAARR